MSMINRRIADTTLSMNQMMAETMNTNISTTKVGPGDLLELVYRLVRELTDIGQGSHGIYLVSL